MFSLYSTKELKESLHSNQIVKFLGTYNGESCREEAKTVHDIFWDAIAGETLDVFPDILPRRYQDGGDQEDESCDSVVQLEAEVVDAVRFDPDGTLELFECAQHLPGFVIFLWTWIRLVIVMQRKCAVCVKVLLHD